MRFLKAVMSSITTEKNKGKNGGNTWAHYKLKKLIWVTRSRFGFGGQIFAGIEVFYVDPLVMTVPAIKRYNAVAIPVHCMVQKKWVPGIFRNTHEFRKYFDACSFSTLADKRASRFPDGSQKYPSLKLNYNPQVCAS